MLVSSNGLRRSKPSKDVLAGTHCVKWNTKRDTPAAAFSPWSDNNVDPPESHFLRTLA